MLTVAFALLTGSVSADRPDHIRCATPLMQEAKVAAAANLVRASDGGPSVRTAGKRMTPPADPNVGDRWDWYIWSLNGPPTANLLPCTVQGESDNLYVVVENSQWGVNVTQEQVDSVLAKFEDHTPGPYPNMGIYDLDTLAFGLPPDELDNDPKVYVLFYDFDVSSDGFFWYFDQYPDGSQPYASNECEVVYINCSDNDVADHYLLAVLAHELEHMIHWNYDENEASWVDEGCAELAMWLYGNPDNISGFNSNPNDPLVTWAGAWTDYIQCYLWTLYFFEQYGGIESVRDVVAEPANSTLGYDTVLSSLGYSEQFTDVFGDWVVANFIDDTSLAGGRYGYVGDDLPAFIAITHNIYPFGPLALNTQITGCKYRRLVDGEPLDIYFDGSDTAVWEPSVIYFNGGVPIDVVEIPLDGLNAGNVIAEGFGSAYDTVVVTLPHASYYGTNSYTFGADLATGVAPGVPLRTALEPNAPNPFNPTTEIRFSLDRAGPVRLTVYDGAGRVVRTLLSGPIGAGDQTIVWDGRDNTGRDAASGVYFSRLDTDSQSLSRKMHLVR